MLFRPKIDPPQDDTRHYCRFPRCRSKLPKPVSSALDAFCAAGCVRGFYRGHCRVCQRRFERKNEREKTCGSVSASRPSSAILGVFGCPLR